MHGSKIQKVSEDTYLGDVISADGQNTKNIKNRISKGLGIITEIMNILESVTLGVHYFSTAILLRESLFLNGILTNCEIWYGLNKSEIQELESLDRNLLRKILKTPFSTPSESFYLELGIMDIETTIKSRRIKYLHYLTTRKESEMIYNFFSTQWKYPTNQKDWTEMVKSDLEDFGISNDLDYIKSKSSLTFKNIVKVKAKEFAFFKFMERKSIHSKMNNLWYTELKTQDYIISNKFTPNQVQTIFSFRTRMAKFQENFRGSSGHIPCPLCHMHMDTQSMSFQCPKVKSEIKVKGQYEDIFAEEIPSELIETVENIVKYREKYLEERKVEN